MPQNEILIWIIFTAVVIGLLILDLGLFHRKARSIQIKEAVAWSIVWITLSLAFNAGVFVAAGSTAGMEFLAGYLLEKALSVDNIFVFLLIFSYFGVPAEFQHKILFWGVLGALVMRSTFILVGTALIAKFGWILYLFGGVLIVSGWKMMFKSDIEVHPDRNIVIRVARRLFPVATDVSAMRFVIRREGKLMIAPLLLVLITVETTDLVFALDSIPAVFGVTRDPFIVYSSNVCAILGLRALYFVLAGAMNSFHYLGRGLAVVLMFIGGKMLAEPFVHIPISTSLLVVASILVVALAASVLFPPSAPTQKHPTLDRESKSRDN